MPVSHESRPLHRALSVLKEILAASEEHRSFESIAEKLKLPSSTIFRLIANLESVGLLHRRSRGRYAAGIELGVLSQFTDLNLLMMDLSRPRLREIATSFGVTCHLGILERGMITCLVKESASPDQLFTEEGLQQEAYFSAIGKLLLAHTPKTVLDKYLRDGDFVPLTDKTIIDPRVLADELAVISEQGFACDEGELIVGMNCYAVPIRGVQGRVLAAISSSVFVADGDIGVPLEIQNMLNDTARDIGAALSGDGS